MVEQILVDMEIDILENKNGTMTLAIPTNKVDVTRPADVTEEVLRIYGYNRIASPGRFSFHHSTLDENPLLKIRERISEYLSDNGFYEIMNNSLTKSDYSRFDFIHKEETVTLMNPLSKDLQQMRQTLLFGGLESIAHNINHSNCNLRMYEFGTIYHRNIESSTKDPVTKRFIHQQRLAIWVTGASHAASWENKAEENSFFYLKNMLTNALEKAGFPVRRLSCRQTEKEEGTSYSLQYFFRNRRIIDIGEVSPELLKSFGIKQRVYYADIDCDALAGQLERKKIRFKELNRFPEVERDLALLIDKETTYGQLEKIALKTDPAIQSVNLFDVYEGEHLPAGKKSYALNFVITNPDGTFTAEEVQTIMDKLIHAYEKEAGAQLR